MRPRLIRPLLPAALALVLCLVGAVPAAGLVGGGAGSGTVGVALLEAPTDRADDPRALVYVVDHLRPGDVIERRIGISNSTDSAVTVDLYAGAAEINADGWAPMEGRTANEATSWTTITPSAATVPINSRAEAVIRVAVPDDATAGEHYAVAWAQLPVESGGTVDVTHRVGIRVYLSVGEGPEPTSDFAIRSAEAITDADGTRRLSVEIDNTGGRAIDVSGEVMLTAGPGGSTAGPFRSPTGPTLGPDDTGLLSLPVPADLPDGTWTAQVVARSGVLERRAEVSVSWSDSSGPVDAIGTDEGSDDGLAVTAADRSFGDVGTLVVSLLAAMLILAVAATALRTHRRQRGVAAAQR